MNHELKITLKTFLDQLTDLRMYYLLTKYQMCEIIDEING